MKQCKDDCPKRKIQVELVGHFTCDYYFIMRGERLCLYDELREYHEGRNDEHN